MFKTTKRAGILFACVLLSACSVFKKHKHATHATPGANGPATDSTRKPPVQIKAYKDVIKGKVSTQKGLITVHQIDDKFYYEIPFALFKRDIMILNRIAESSSIVRLSNKSDGYSGDGIGGNIIRFEKGPYNKLLIRKVYFFENDQDSTKSMYKAVKRNNLQPIIASLPIAAFSPDSSAVVVDMTQILNTDSELFYFAESIYKQFMHIGAQVNDKSYVKYVHSYPENVEIRAIKTYGIAGATYGGNITMELNSSMVVLPEKPMKSRLADERVGYFTDSYIDYDANPQGVKDVSMVSRWRLEPKPEDRERYLRGELVEPVKPIVFYIDPATPAKWVPYLIKGINDWNVAFEKAGFKNAIVGKVAPTEKEDPDFSIEDARHSVIVYKPSVVANAAGPHISDPRSGEIMESHIDWYHNVMNLIHNWYMVQCAAIDPKARKMQFDDELMGQLIRFVSSHEVGHTLGLRHNFGSSSTVPVDSLRNKAWVEAHGHTPSIMDYARFNYVAQPEDNISEKGIFPRIGDYDIWAIQWGYRWFPDSTSVETEKQVLSKWTTEKSRNKRLWFGSETNRIDPRTQNEDLGDNAMIAGGYGIKNLQRILPNLVQWTTEPAEGYNNLGEMYGAVNSQFDRYLIHVLRYIGGRYETPKLASQPGPVFEPVSRKLQLQALDFFNTQLFVTPNWVLEKSIIDKLNVNPMVVIGQRQDGVLSNLLHPATIGKLLSAQTMYGGKVLQVDEFFDLMQHYICKEFYSGSAKNIDIYRRNLQKMYTEKLITMAFPVADKPGGNNSQVNRQNDVMPATYIDAASIARVKLNQLDELLKQNQGRFSTLESKAHIADLRARIKRAFTKSNND
ncbi:protein of unknown function [Mucilaginibacter gossypiicola]|uniref:Zinc-dependent metalloprotease n=1 Tax=Mucilaginibacter gossypiicola TaxID=551995 RepID=A0A1H8LM87_9SPHI|nr:zinc-dependent metalloprotease [Mucilaginibacter gossypiicola]SEO06270.1 protein of unknown function [Mucilaginibacter gossypiicola]